MLVGAIVVVLVIVLALTLGGGPGPRHQSAGGRHRKAAGTPLSADWRGDGKAVTLAFGGDVHFEGVLADRLATDPSTALGSGAPALLSGSDVAVADFDSALTDSPTHCPEPAPVPYPFYTGPSALTAMAAAHLTAVSEANNHALDCGPAGLALGLSAATAASYPLIGVGKDAAEAYAPFRTTVRGQRVAVIAATQVLEPSLQSAWTASASQGGVASAFAVDQLVAAVQAARRTADTVVVYLHWGVEAHSCPVAQQATLARALVKAGADVVVGANAHVLQGAGYLGSAVVDYGLGNFAFYDTAPPETTTGTLLVTITGRHVDGVTWRPATLQGGVPVPVTGGAAARATRAWEGLRGCAHLAATASKSLATPASQSRPPPPAVVRTLSQNSGQS